MNRCKQCAGHNYIYERNGSNKKHIYSVQMKKNPPITSKVQIIDW